MAEYNFKDTVHMQWRRVGHVVTMLSSRESLINCLRRKEGTEKAKTNKNAVRFMAYTRLGFVTQ